jgi:hypothetical protein
MPRAASTGLHYKERIKSSELLANDLDIDCLQAFTEQLCNKTDGFKDILEEFPRHSMASSLYAGSCGAFCFPLPGTEKSL